MAMRSGWRSTRGARMIGVNNRDLRTFEVDIHNSERLRSLVPGNGALCGGKAASGPRRISGC